MFIDGAPVCDYSWGWEDAQVACRSQGYNHTFKPFGYSHFGEVPDIFLNGIAYMACTGDENSLKECSFFEFTKCSRNRGAGVVCTNEEPGFNKLHD